MYENLGGERFHFWRVRELRQWFAKQKIGNFDATIAYGISKFLNAIYEN